MKKIILFFSLILSSLFGFAQCDVAIAGFDPVSLEMTIIVYDGHCGSSADSIGEFLLTLTFDPVIPADENPFPCFSQNGDTDLLFPLDLPFVNIGEGEDEIIQSGDTLTFNLIESQPLGLGTTSCWQEAINAGAFESCIVLFINQINDSATLDGSTTGLGGFSYPDTNVDDNVIIFSLTDACGGLPPPPIYFGCTNPEATNFDPQANTDDGSCVIEGCTDVNALNFDPEANSDDGSCLYMIFGCTDPLALNYNPLASVDDNSCLYENAEPSECHEVSIFVPNVFSPNNDGVNDGFQVITKAQCFLEWKTYIFNRWGSVVWKADSPDSIWYGEGYGETHYVSDGVYVYKIQATGTTPENTQSVLGHVTIFR